MDDQPKPIDMSAALAELWSAANTHCICMCGEYIIEHDGDDNPPVPDDPIEIIRLVAEYLKSTV